MFISTYPYDDTLGVNSSHYITHGVKSDHWPKVVSARFYHCEVTLSLALPFKLLPYSTYLRGCISRLCKYLFSYNFSVINLASIDKLMHAPVW